MWQTSVVSVVCSRAHSRAASGSSSGTVGASSVAARSSTSTGSAVACGSSVLVCIVVSPPLLVGGLGGVGREVLDAVGAEAGPVVVGGDDDGGLEVAEGHDVVAGGGVGGDVDERVLEAGLVEGLDGGAALHALRLGVDGDGHGGLRS